MNQNKIDRALRGIAGFFLIFSLLMYFYHSPNWIWFIGFIGLNLFQSAFTSWCPMMCILRKLFPESDVESECCSGSDKSCC